MRRGISLVDMTQLKNITRRSFLGVTLAALPGLSLARLLEVESEQLVVKKMVLNGLTLRKKFVHLTDLHFSGKSLVTEATIEVVRRLKPDFACFTGDLVDTPEYAEGAFAFIQSLGCPVYGVPGNHDYWSTVPFADYAKAFRATGGNWLVNSSVVIEDGKVEIVGTAKTTSMIRPGSPEADLRILLTHYPTAADLYENQPFTVVLAGHSHGGQVRFPFYGPLYLPEGVGDYVLGQFETAAGIMNVSAGLGMSVLPIRFHCCPDISVIIT